MDEPVARCGERPTQQLAEAAARHPGRLGLVAADHLMQALERTSASHGNTPDVCVHACSPRPWGFKGSAVVKRVSAALRRELAPLSLRAEFRLPNPADSGRGESHRSVQFAKVGRFSPAVLRWLVGNNA